MIKKRLTSFGLIYYPNGCLHNVGDYKVDNYLEVEDSLKNKVKQSHFRTYKDEFRSSTSYCDTDEDVVDEFETMRNLFCQFKAEILVIHSGKDITTANEDKIITSESEDCVPVVLWDRKTEKNIEFKILEDLMYEVGNDVMSFLSDNKFAWNNKQVNILTNYIIDMSQDKNVEVTCLSSNFEDTDTVAVDVTNGVPDRFNNIGTNLPSSVDFRDGIDETITYKLSIKSQAVQHIFSEHHTYDRYDYAYNTASDLQLL